MTNDQAISTLNHLVQTCKDGEHGFKTAAEGLKDPTARATFERYSREREQMARELQEEVRKLGGDPEKAGSVSAAVHRGWMNIKSVVTGKDDAAIIAEAERGEDVAKAAFEQALNETLPPDVRAIVQRHSAKVREAHDKVRAMEKASAR